MRRFDISIPGTIIIILNYYHELLLLLSWDSGNGAWEMGGRDRNRWMRRTWMLKGDHPSSFRAVSVIFQERKIINTNESSMCRWGRLNTLPVSLTLVEWSLPSACFAHGSCEWIPSRRLWKFIHSAVFAEYLLCAWVFPKARFKQEWDESLTLQRLKV